MDFTKELAQIMTDIKVKHQEIQAIKKKLNNAKDDADLLVDLETFKDELDGLYKYRSEVLQVVALTPKGIQNFFIKNE